MAITKIYIVYSPAPFVLLEKDNVIENVGRLKNEIHFNELSKYIQLLEAQQLALNEFVGCRKTVYTLRHRNYPCIEIYASATDPNLPNNPVVMDIKIDGVSFGAAEQLNGELYADTITPFVLTTFGRGAIIYMRIPALNIDGYQDMLRDYDFAVNEGSFQIIGKTILSGGYYYFYVSFAYQPTLFTITSKQFLYIYSEGFTGNDQVLAGYIPIGLNPPVFQLLSSISARISMPQSTQVMLSRYFGVTLANSLWVIEYDAGGTPIFTTEWLPNIITRGQDIQALTKTIIITTVDPN